MNTDQTIEQLQALRLGGMALRYSAIADLPVHQLQNVHELVAGIVQAEIEHRDHAKTQKYLKASRLRYLQSLKKLCVPQSGESRKNKF